MLSVREETMSIDSNIVIRPKEPNKLLRVLFAPRKHHALRVVGHNFSAKEKS
jgi:hypothetical protein